MNYHLEHLHHDTITDNDVTALNSLLQQLLPGLRTVLRGDVTEILDARDTIAVVRDERGTICGMATLIVYSKLAKGAVGIIEDVVVDSAHRKAGIGTMLMQELIRIAKERSLASIYLTSSDSRQDAHRLYEKFGFTKKDTNFFGLIFR